MTHGKLFLVQTLGMSWSNMIYFKQDPDSVDPELKNFFELSGPPTVNTVTGQKTVVENQTTLVSTGEVLSMEKITSAVKLTENIRSYGHLAANINPLNELALDNELLHLEKYELTEGRFTKNSG